MRAVAILLLCSTLAHAEPRLLLDDPVEHARNKKRTGVALLVLGSLNLALGIGMGLGENVVCRRSNCEFFDAVALGTTLGSGLVATILIGVSIPVYLGGVRDAERARSAPPVRVDADEVLARARHRRDAGIVVTAMGFAASTMLAVTTPLMLGGHEGAFAPFMTSVVLSPILLASGIPLWVSGQRKLSLATSGLRASF